MSGRKIVHTSVFMRNLAALKHGLSLHEANRWIRLNVRTFRDASTAEGENKLWFQLNPNRGL